VPIVQEMSQRTEAMKMRQPQRLSVIVVVLSPWVYFAIVEQVLKTEIYGMNASYGVKRV
jgi:hypothetical protein